jgi:hypothetical protein
MSTADQPRAPDLIRRRHVFYVAGYDPQGAESYYALFRREFGRFKMLWPLRGSLTPPDVAADAHSARWRIETAAPNWQVSVDYEFLSWDDIILRDLARPMRWRLLQALFWFIDQLFTGTLRRVFRGFWRFGLFLIYPMLGLVLWLAVAAMGGWLAWYIAVGLAAPPPFIAAVLGGVVFFALFWLLRPIADGAFVVQLTDLWLFFRDYVRGGRADFEKRIDAFAARLVASARASDADEIVVVGHSGGAVAAALMVARALALDPGLGKHGPRIVLLTLGSIMPAIALHPCSVRVRDVILRLATESGLLWIDCQSNTDMVNFFDFDPVTDVGIDAGPARCNPVVFHVRFSTALASEFYHRQRWNFFRIHFQFIMANDRKAPYDYYLYLCGPLPLAVWTGDRTRTIEEFGPDASLRGG